MIRACAQEQRYKILGPQIFTRISPVLSCANQTPGLFRSNCRQSQPPVSFSQLFTEKWCKMVQILAAAYGTQQSTPQITAICAHFWVCCKCLCADSAIPDAHMHNLLAVEESQPAGNISRNPSTPVQSSSPLQPSGAYLVSSHVAAFLRTLCVAHVRDKNEIALPAPLSCLQPC